VKPEIEELIGALDKSGYVAEREIATALHLSLNLGKPLLVEGAAGVGKTEIAKALADLLRTDLIRLQCYEGLDVSTALYEWNYQKQLLRIRLEGDPGGSAAEIEETIFGAEYLLERPLLRAIRQEKPAVLLIDEIDRADEEFEAFLLELLSDFQVSIPELGTVQALSRPHTVLTSNGTRELSDALRRRCLFLWIDYPSPEKELRILRARFPNLQGDLAGQTVRLVQRLRREELSKTPGLTETLDFAAAMEQLDARELDMETIRDALGCLLKDRNDVAAMDAEMLEMLLQASGERSVVSETPTAVDSGDA
jgi:MoxR-like ATPase